MKNFMRLVSAFAILYLSVLSAQSLLAQEQPKTISMTTSKKIGDAIGIKVVAEGDFSLQGISSYYFLDPETLVCTLSSEKVVISGEVLALNCSDNELTHLDVTNMPSLTGLICNNNCITSLDLSKNESISHLHCHNNLLEQLDVSKNSKIEFLRCSDNKLTRLDLSNNSSITHLRCSGNEIKQLDLSPLLNLKKLFCDRNQLSELSLSKNTSLTHLYCHNNFLKDEAMTRMFNSLPPCTTSSKGFICVVNQEEGNDEHNICTKDDVEIAKAKNWEVYATLGSTGYVPHEGSFPETCEDVQKKEVKPSLSLRDRILHVDKVDAEGKVIIFSVDGHRLLDGDADQSGIVKIDLTSLIPGVYLLRSGVSIAELFVLK
ncbi:Internalin-J precursor [Porphyromonas crevioricanis]|uniref:Internalin-J n=2 Tax=Porphyromonas crevioricanis TaxID=393921 RepID=A0A2X4PMI5_9PORP|nr:hypothetical protein SAMN02745203_01016 [Porphyromonas crevioricanis]SQH73083.1 Internalin-J precursor [Porphyromonas crevioricanis]